MSDLIPFLKDALRKDLPHETVEQEDLSPLLKQSLIQNAKDIAAKKLIPRPCGVLLAFYQKNNEWYVPFIVRPQKSRTHAGQIAFPGGKKEAGDADLLETAIRETTEEIGVWVEKHQIIGTLSDIYIPPSNAMVKPVVAVIRQPPIFTPNQDEVDMVLQIKLNDILNASNKKIKKIPLSEKVVLEMPSYKIEDREIWGGTARILDELNKILKPWG